MGRQVEALTHLLRVVRWRSNWTRTSVRKSCRPSQQPDRPFSHMHQGCRMQLPSCGPAVTRPWPGQAMVPAGTRHSWSRYGATAIRAITKHDHDPLTD